MDEKIFELSFEIIGYAGNAKGMAFEAISKAKAGNIDEAIRVAIYKKHY